MVNKQFERLVEVTEEHRIEWHTELMKLRSELLEEFQELRSELQEGLMEMRKEFREMHSSLAGQIRDG